MEAGKAMKVTLARVALPPRPKESLRPSGSGIRVMIYSTVLNGGNGKSGIRWRVGHSIGNATEERSGHGLRYHTPSDSMQEL